MSCAASADARTRCPVEQPPPARGLQDSRPRLNIGRAWSRAVWRVVLASNQAAARRLLRPRIEQVSAPAAAAGGALRTRLLSAQPRRSGSMARAAEAVEDQHAVMGGEGAP